MQLQVARVSGIGFRVKSMNLPFGFPKLLRMTEGAGHFLEDFARIRVLGSGFTRV